MHSEHEAGQDAQRLSAGMTALLSVAGCLILANLYYAQPILTNIAESIGLKVAESGLIVTMIQMGYATGLLFLVPLGDVMENRRLIAGMVFGAALSLLVAASSGGAGGFLAASFFIGLFSSSMQIIIPFAAYLAEPAKRGKTLGLLIAGAILGMVLARPAAGITTGAVGWRPVYFVAAALMLALCLALFCLLPRQAPSLRGISYPAMLGSMWRLLTTVPRLPLRLTISAVVLLGFSIFWATVPIVLRENMNFSHFQAAMFSLAALATPPCAIMVGRLIDRGYSHILIFVGVSLAAAAFLLTAWLGMYAAAFVFAVFMLDPGMNMTMFSIQQNVLSSVPEARSRLNAINSAAAFCGGAVGSALGPWLFSHFGWQTVAYVGASVMLAPFVINLRLHGSEWKALCCRIKRK